MPKVINDVCLKCIEARRSKCINEKGEVICKILKDEIKRNMKEAKHGNGKK